MQWHIENNVPMLVVGPTGTGKSFYMQNMLMHKLSEDKYLPAFLTFTAQTSANLTQVSTNIFPIFTIFQRDMRSNKTWLQIKYRSSISGTSSELKRTQTVFLTFQMFNVYWHIVQFLPYFHQYRSVDCVYHCDDKLPYVCDITLRWQNDEISQDVSSGDIADHSICCWLSSDAHYLSIDALHCEIGLLQNIDNTSWNKRNGKHCTHSSRTLNSLNHLSGYFPIVLAMYCRMTYNDASA
jgi:Sigma54-dependent transcription regulator containing an AAA-type ATPase domain and a DNA-binding domain